MQRVDGERLYSAADLIAFLECEHPSALDLRALDDHALRAERSQADESQQLIADKGDAHEKRHLTDQRGQGREVVGVMQTFLRPPVLPTAPIAWIQAACR